MSEPLDLDAIEARATAANGPDSWEADRNLLLTSIPYLIARVQELEPRVLEGDWETVRDALDALPEGAQIRWRTGMANRPELAIHRGHYWHSTNGPQPIDSDNIARDETPIEVIA